VVKLLDVNASKTAQQQKLLQATYTDNKRKHTSNQHCNRGLNFAGKVQCGVPALLKNCKKHTGIMNLVAQK